jgi:hypothetical protein
VTRFAICAALLLPVALLGATTHGGAAPAAGKVVDRTLTCTTGYQGGARVIFVRAQSAYGAGGRLEWLAGAYVSTPGQPVATRPGYQPSLAGVSAGWPPPPAVKSGGLGFENRRCVPSRARVALSRRGLTGGPALELGDEYTCIVPKAVLVRVRAVFRAPVTVELVDRRRSSVAAGRMVKGQIAVATTSGKPIAYAEVAEAAGKSRLFTSRGCS